MLRVLKTMYLDYANTSIIKFAPVICIKKQEERLHVYLSDFFLLSLFSMIKTAKRDYLFKCMTNLSARNPFEMMVAVFIACSFSYLYLTNTYNKGLDSTGSPHPVYIYGNHSIRCTDDNSVILKQLVLNNHQDMMAKDALRSVLLFQKSIEQDISDFCYRNENGNCFIKSSLNYWSNNIAKLNADRNVKLTINQQSQKDHFLINNHNNYADAVVLSFAFDRSQYDRVNRWEHNIAKLGYIFSHQSKQQSYMKAMYNNVNVLYQVIAISLCSNVIYMQCLDGFLLRHQILLIRKFY